MSTATAPSPGRKGHMGFSELAVSATFAKLVNQSTEFKWFTSIKGKRFFPNYT